MWKCARELTPGTIGSQNPLFHSETAHTSRLSRAECCLTARHRIDMIISVKAQNERKRSRRLCAATDLSRWRGDCCGSACLALIADRLAASVSRKTTGL